MKNVEISACSADDRKWLKQAKLLFRGVFRTISHCYITKIRLKTALKRSDPKPEQWET